MSLFSLHVGKSHDLDSRHISTLSRSLAIGDIRTHIRVPGGVFSVAIYYAEDGEVVYAAVNAGPMETNGQIAVRWKAPHPGTYRAVLWKQGDRILKKIFGAVEFESLVKTKVTEFTFCIL